jgi:hypothetical protein
MLFWATLADKAGDAVPDSRQLNTKGTSYVTHLPGSAVSPSLLLAGLVQARFAPGTCSSTCHTGSEPALDDGRELNKCVEAILSLTLQP